MSIVLQVDRDNNIGPQRTSQGYRDGIHHRAIDQETSDQEYYRRLGQPDANHLR